MNASVAAPASAALEPAHTHTAPSNKHHYSSIQKTTPTYLRVSAEPHVAQWMPPDHPPPRCRQSQCQGRGPWHCSPWPGAPPGQRHRVLAMSASTHLVRVQYITHRTSNVSPALRACAWPVPRACRAWTAHWHPPCCWDRRGTPTRQSSRSSGVNQNAWTVSRANQGVWYSMTVRCR